MIQELIWLLLVVAGVVAAIFSYRAGRGKRVRPIDATDEAVLESEVMSDETKAQRKEFAKEIISYLSKEIETVNNGMMVFRSKISFAVLVGPFVILGALLYATKGLPISTSLGAGGWTAIGFVCVCYLALAFLSGLIEEDGWRQCNKWRKLVSDLHKNPTMEIGDRILRTDKKDVDPGHFMKWSYLLACALMLASFASLVFILSRVRTNPLVESQSTNASSSAQGTTGGNGTTKP